MFYMGHIGSSAASKMSLYQALNELVSQEQEI